MNHNTLDHSSEDFIVKGESYQLHIVRDEEVELVELWDKTHNLMEFRWSEARKEFMVSSPTNSNRTVDMSVLVQAIKILSV